MISRKGAFSEFGEMIVVLIAFFIIIIIAIFIVGKVRIDVEGTVQAENAKFTCKHDATTFLKFDSPSGTPFDELLITSYSTGDFTKFETETSLLFDNLIGSGKWKMEVRDNKGILSKIGTVPDKSEECGVYVPLPCRIGSSCRLRINLRLAY